MSDLGKTYNQGYNERILYVGEITHYRRSIRENTMRLYELHGLGKTSLTFGVNDGTAAGTRRWRASSLQVTGRMTSTRLLAELIENMTLTLPARTHYSRRALKKTRCYLCQRSLIMSNTNSITAYIQRARKVLQYEQRNNHQDRLVQGGLELFASRWAEEFSAARKEAGL